MTVIVIITICLGNLLLNTHTSLKNMGKKKELNLSGTESSESDAIRSQLEMKYRIVNSYW